MDTLLSSAVVSLIKPNHKKEKKLEQNERPEKPINKDINFDKIEVKEGILKGMLKSTTSVVLTN